MNEPSAVVLTSTLQWPQGALGQRPLLAFEVYEPTALALEDRVPLDVEAWLLQRGFERLVADEWTFPYLEDHVLGVFEDLGQMALIDEADDLFTYPLGGLPAQWCEHLKRERNCLLITGKDLRLSADGMAGVERAVRRGEAFGGMVLINDGMF